MGEGYLRNLWKWSQREVRTLIILQQSETLIQAFSIQMYTFLPNDINKIQLLQMIYYNVHFYVHVFIT